MQVPRHYKNTISKILRCCCKMCGLKPYNFVEQAEGRVGLIYACLIYLYLLHPTVDHKLANFTIHPVTRSTFCAEPSVSIGLVHWGAIQAGSKNNPITIEQKGCCAWAFPMHCFGSVQIITSRVLVLFGFQRQTMDEDAQVCP